MGSTDSGTLTVLGSLPSCLYVLAKPTRSGFVLCLLNSSLSFFLFSYQVHEKSILLPLIPATLLIG